MNPNLKRDFETQFDAKIEPGSRRMFRKQPVSWSNYNVPAEANALYLEEVSSLTIHISEEEFEHLLQYIPGKLIRERRIREDIPAVQKAWDNYQLLLKMCGGDYI